MIKQFQLPEHIAVMIAECYNEMSAAQNLAREIVKDEQSPGAVKSVFINIAASIDMPMKRIEKHVPECRKEAFKNQIADADPLAFDNVKRMFFKLSSKQKEVIEVAMTYMISGREVNLIDDNK